MPQPGTVARVEALSPARPSIRKDAFLPTVPTVHFDRGISGFFVGGVLKSLLAEQQQRRSGSGRSSPLAPEQGSPRAGLAHFTWTLRIDSTRLNMGMLFMGVCDLHGKNAWGLCPFDGRLHRLSRDSSSGAVSFVTSPPPDMPDGQDIQVLRTPQGQPATWTLLGCEAGTELSCSVDGNGAFSFSIDNGTKHAIRATVPGLVFPKNTPLRKWAFVVDAMDRVLEVENQGAREYFR